MTRQMAAWSSQCGKVLTVVSIDAMRFKERYNIAKRTSRPLSNGRGNQNAGVRNAGNLSSAQRGYGHV